MAVLDEKNQDEELQDEEEVSQAEEQEADKKETADKVREKLLALNDGIQGQIDKTRQGISNTLLRCKNGIINAKNNIIDKAKALAPTAARKLGLLLGGLCLLVGLFFFGIYLGLYNVDTIRKNVDLTAYPEYEQPVKEYLQAADDYSKISNMYLGVVSDGVVNGGTFLWEMLPDADKVVGFVGEQYTWVANKVDEYQQEREAAAEAERAAAETTAAEQAEAEKKKTAAKSKSTVKVNPETVEKQLKLAQAAEKKRIGKLARLYNQMKPAEAAVILSDLENYVIMDIFNKMDEAQVAKILAEFTPERSAELTKVMYSGKPPVATVR